MKITTGLLLAVSTFALVTLPAMAATTGIALKKATPTVDGTINSAEYPEKIELTATNSKAWAGSISGEVTAYFAWDDKGLYVAADIKDSTQGASDTFQIALNPNGQIAGTEQGIFYSFTCKEFTAKRHNYSEIDITSKVTGKSVSSSSGYQLEVLIPWAEINVLSSKFTPQTDLKIDLLIAYIDIEGDTTNAWKTVMTDGDVNSFSVNSYALTLTLAAADDNTTTKASAAGDKPVDETPNTGVVSGIVCIAVLGTVAALLVVATKRKKLFE